MARYGTSINRVVVRKPTHIHVSDACPISFGAMLMTGRSYMPVLRNHLHIKTLAFWQNFYGVVGMHSGFYHKK